VAIIIGAGPAGLTTAYELLKRSDVHPVVLEKSEYMGGISRTVNYKGNRIDIGGHRFFSKSDRVMNWWLQHMPIANHQPSSPVITYQGQSRTVPNPNGAAEPGAATGVCPDSDAVMLVRSRKSRIYFLRRFFAYPITLSRDTLAKLGVSRTMRIGFSYLRSSLWPVRPVKNLEDFFINRFGRELYLTFFKSYTEKVWGIPCDGISAEWGEQRIKGLSIRKAIAYFARGVFRPARKGGIAQKETETSLIEQFLYPKHGPGQMWELVAQKIQHLGGEILTGCNVAALHVQDGRIAAVTVNDGTGKTRRFEGDLFFSTMPVKELVASLDVPADAPVPEFAREISDGLQYRDFITVGLLLKQMHVQEGDKLEKLISDNWIYIQEPDVLAGRLQIFNNWSPSLVADPEKVWIGVEYFCYETDDLWHKSDAAMAELAIAELSRIGLIRSDDVLDSTILRMPKTYPAYFGTYNRFGELRKYMDGFENLYLIGRNGMHKYNNQDHSMLTAMVAVDNIVAGRKDKENLWTINTEMEYHESK
jgi:protoporphyrinogen oxidase